VNGDEKMDFEDKDERQRFVLDDKVMGRVAGNVGVFLDPTEASRELMDMGYITAPQDVVKKYQPNDLSETDDIVDETYISTLNMD
jgi:hypothetical protein